MEINLSPTDRMIRLVLGTALLYAALLAPNGWGILLIAVGLSALVNGATGRCLIYRLLGISTAKPAASAEPVGAVKDAMRAGRVQRLTVRDGDWTVIDIPLTVTPSGALEVPLLEFLRARAEVAGYSQLTVRH